jgi:opacity protein-like surface antigen
MKTIITALVLAAAVATSALAQSRSTPYPSYDCGPAQYDSSGAPVAQYCD